ncbi:proton-conducting transporter membrane subunit [Salinisphaera sp. P385]|uniref:Proton-conducting transporter membrane subunit n=2 Tax=Spectribacter acetivorans TaxID=3075603 RepID=A0ABU3B976_9GAMM|nr:proton-conducting transporter membrane subunit [Salinisphaera sp. P385]MDT0618738.1 proton-conducting transporter membrane subunit [Salinisphaera sp. P385]
MTIALPWLMALPAAGALGVMALGRWPNLRDGLSVVTALLLFAAACSWLGPVLDGARPAVTLIPILPGLSLSLALEPLGLLFALVASGLWIVTAIYAIGYMRGNDEHNQTRFFACFALALAAAMGIALAGNLLTLFLFYEMLTLSTYPLVAHKGNDDARAGGRTYLGVLLTTSIGLLLPAIILTWVVAGTLDFTPGGILQGHIAPAAAAGLFALYLFGTGKAALMPFHRWLPAAMVAPTPVSALLHAVAVVKAGVFAVLKITVYVFGIDFAAAGDFTTPMMWVAAFTILAASVVALTRDNLKARLAYSTIGQLAYIVLGATLANGMAIAGGATHIVMHAFGKITLFFCAGAIYTAVHRTRVSELDGLGRVMPFTMGAFLVASLSIIGLPPLGGAWSKWALMVGAADAGQLLMIAVLAISSLLNIVYLLDIPARAFFRPGTDLPAGRQEAPLACVVPLCVTAAGSVVLFFVGGHILQLLAPVTGS